MEGLEVHDKVICRNEGQHVSFEAFDVRIAEGFRFYLFNDPVHPLGLPVGPWVIRLGEVVLDAMPLADTVEDMAAEDGIHCSVSTPSG